MGSDTRAPTSDIAVTGSITGTANSRYTYVDDYADTTPTDYLEFGTATSTIVFGFTAFSIPSDATITNVQVQYYDAEPSNGTNSVAGRLRVGSTDYNASTHNPSGTTYTSRTDTWTQNPATSAAWTYDEVNGTDATTTHRLNGFGVHSGDSNPVFRVSCIRLVCNYTRNYTATLAGTLDSSGAISSVPTSGFEIDRKAGAGSYSRLAWLFSSAATTYEDSAGLSGGTTYTYRIRQYSAGSPGSWSNEPSVAYSTGVTVTLSGSLASSGAIAQSRTKGIAGTLATAGAFIKAHTMPLAGTLASAGVLVRRPIKALAGTLASSGTIGSVIQRVVSVAGTLASSGALIKSHTLAVAGTLASSGTYARLLNLYRSYTGTLASSGTITAARVKLVSVAGTLVTHGAYELEMLYKRVAGTLASSGALLKTHTQTLAGTLASSGSISVFKGKLVSLAGTLASSGTLVRSHSLALAGTLASSGMLLKTVLKAVAGTLATAGTIVSSKVKMVAIAGTLATSGALKQTMLKAVAGTLATSGELRRTATHAYAGTLATAGTLAKQPAKLLAGTLASAGTLRQSATHALAGTLTTTGDLSRRVLKALSGVLTTAGAIESHLGFGALYYVAVAGTLQTAGTLAKRLSLTLTGTLASSGIWYRSLRAVRATITAVGMPIASVARALVAGAVGLINPTAAVSVVPDPDATATANNPTAEVDE